MTDALKPSPAVLCKLGSIALLAAHPSTVTSHQVLTRAEYMVQTIEQYISGHGGDPRGGHPGDEFTSLRAAVREFRKALREHPVTSREQGLEEAALHCIANAERNERLGRQYAAEGNHSAVSSCASFASTSRILASKIRNLAQPAAVEVKALDRWQCKDCGCKTYARVDEAYMGDRGRVSYRPGPDVCCVNCKRHSPWPDAPTTPVCDARTNPLPCPFCGQPAIRMVDLSTDPKTNSYRCDNDDCDVRPTTCQKARTRLRAFSDELRKWWSFDNGHIHTHSWHDREDFIAKKLPELLSRLPSADRLAQCEASLSIYDAGHDSEYWLRNPSGEASAASIIDEAGKDFDAWREASDPNHVLTIENAAALYSTDKIWHARHSEEAEVYKHKKRGTVYTVIGEAELQTASRVEEGDELVVYRGEDGRLWTRPYREFHDGRFEPITRAPGAVT